MVEGHERRPEHDGVSDLVYAAAAGAPGELGVLPWCEELVPLTGEFGELLDDHAAGRHVDAESQCLGGEHDLHEPGREARLDRLFERRDHPRVVGGDPRFQAGQPPAVAQHVEVVVTQGFDLPFDDRADLCPLLFGGQPYAGIQQLSGGVVARLTAEDEVDGGKHPLPLEPVDDVNSAWGRQPAAGSAPVAR